MSRGTTGTPEKKKAAFLEVLARGMSVSAACRAASLGRATVYRLRQQDEEFALAWADAYKEGTERCEDEVLRRAVEGYDAGNGITRYSDNLLMFTLKAREPEKYRDTVQVNATVTSITRDEARMAREVAERDPEAFERMAAAWMESQGS